MFRAAASRDGAPSHVGEPTQDAEVQTTPRRRKDRSEACPAVLEPLFGLGGGAAEEAGGGSDELAEVELTEVVRNSQRIVAAAAPTRGRDL